MSHSAFLFTLKNKNSSKPFKLPLKTSPSQDAIYSCSNCCPIFGGGHDLYITSEACSLKNESLNSYINLNVTYQLPSDVDNQDTFAEMKHFCLSLIEIFYECYRYTVPSPKNKHLCLSLIDVSLNVRFFALKKHFCLSLIEVCHEY